MNNNLVKTKVMFERSIIPNFVLKSMFSVNTNSSLMIYGSKVKLCAAVTKTLKQEINILTSLRS